MLFNNLGNLFEKWQESQANYIQHSRENLTNRGAGEDDKVSVSKLKKIRLVVKLQTAFSKAEASSLPGQ